MVGIVKLKLVLLLGNCTKSITALIPLLLMSESSANPKEIFQKVWRNVLEIQLSNGVSVEGNMRPNSRDLTHEPPKYSSGVSVVV